MNRDNAEFIAKHTRSSSFPDYRYFVVSRYVDSGETHVRAYKRIDFAQDYNAKMLGDVNIEESILVDTQPVPEYAPKAFWVDKHEITDVFNRLARWRKISYGYYVVYRYDHSQSQNIWSGLREQWYATSERQARKMARAWVETGKVPNV